MVRSSIFESITGKMIQKLSLKTKSSLFDADDWKRIIGTKLFGTTGTDLPKSMARLARGLCTEEFEDPLSIAALIACRLVPLDKNPVLKDQSV